MAAHYDRASAADALRRAGVRPGDVVFSHSNVGFFGVPEEGRTSADVFRVLLGAFIDVLGPEGTLVVPTFTYSFPKMEVYDPAATPSTCGIFTEMLRTTPGARRSDDPIFSVAAVGCRAAELTADSTPECFGRGSFWNRLMEADGLICNMNFDAGSTFVHYVERCLNVPYRYDKEFPGRRIRRGKLETDSAIYFVRDVTNPDTYPAFEPFDSLARERGVARRENLGRGAVVALRARDAYRLIEQELKHRPWLLTEAEKSGRTPVLLRRTDLMKFGPPLPPDSSAETIARALSGLSRDLVSEGMDASFDLLGHQVPLVVREFPTGTRLGDALVPELWSCSEAYVEDEQGRRVISREDHPHTVVSYSQAFQGTVSRDALLAHLHDDPSAPEAVPFRSARNDRSWGFCVNARMRASLAGDQFKVVIRASFRYGTLKIAEAVAPGRSGETVLLVASLAPPNGDREAATAVKVMRALLTRPLRRTHRLLILPDLMATVSPPLAQVRTVMRVEGAPEEMIARLEAIEAVS